MRNIKFPLEVNTLPETPGVYQFRDATGHIIYIGKAKNLKSRVRSYTAATLLPKTARMVSDAKTLTFIEVSSEFEALLLEANLIRAHMPLFNIDLKDDKSPLYIGITKEEFPRVLTLRETQLTEMKLKKVFGPYLDSGSARYVLKKLRYVFPFSTHKIGKKACIYQEIGLCNPCPSAILQIEDPVIRDQKKKEYLRNVRRLSGVLSGKASAIEKELMVQMNELSKTEQYEAAQKVKEKITRFRRTLGTPPRLGEYLKDPNFIDDIHARELAELTNIIQTYFDILPIHRIECFDIAHLSGTHPTASMVTFIDGEADKRFYRHFKINKGKRQNSDVDSMKEVLSRRIKHFDDWGKPDLIIIDGGKPQITASSEILSGIVPFVGLAKRYETFVFLTSEGFKEIVLPEGNAKKLVQRLRDEAHRFARRLHHNLVTKTLLSKV